MGFSFQIFPLQERRLPYDNPERALIVEIPVLKRVISDLKWRSAGVFVPALMLASAYSVASTAYLAISPHPGQTFSAQTYAGKADVIVSEVQPSPSITILVLTDTLAATEREQVTGQLLEFYTELHGHPLQLAQLGKNGEFTMPVPVTSRARLKQLLGKSSGGEDVQTVPLAVVLDDLLAAIPKLGPKLSTVLVVGEFPKLDPATAALASALLVNALAAQQLRASLISPVSPEQDWSAAFIAAGGQAVTSPKDLSLAPAGSANPILQLDWPTPPPVAGFVVSSTVIRDEQGGLVASVPSISQAEGVVVPSIDQFSEGQKKLAEAQTLLGEDLTQARADRIREDLQAALQVNARDPGALTIATSLYEKAKAYPDAVKMAGYLVEVAPNDGSAYARFGHVLRLNSDFAHAEDALKKAAELGVTTSQFNEDFARLHLARKDDKGALPYLQEVLNKEPKRKDIWFLQAEAAERAGDASLAEHSYEQGFSLGEGNIVEVSSLVHLYSEGKKTDRAAELAKSHLDNLPASAEDRLVFATTLDELHQNDLSLKAWRAVLETQPNSEKAHTRVARLLLESGNAKAAEEEAINGLATVPNSAALHLVKADAEEKQGHLYEAKHTLEESADSISDSSFANQVAITEEQFFGGAPAAYARLVELSAPSSAEQLKALQRGFEISMRDGDLKRAEKFAASLDASGQKQYRTLLGSEKSKTSWVMVPGGLSSLAFAAHANNEEIPPERFLYEYSRTVINGGADKGSKNPYLEGIRQYFERIASLRALGTSTSDGFVVTLSLHDKGSRQQTEKALNVLGIKLKSSKGAIEIEEGEKKSQAVKQETAAALAVDEVGIQDALQAGKSYRLELHDEAAAVFPSEKMWREALDLKASAPGGFADDLVRVPHMASLYVGLNSMDRAAAEELLKTASLKELCEHDADLLSSFGAALALEGTHAAVPGGAKGEAIWTSLVGVSPATPGPFFRALLKHEDGKLLVYFSILAQLDRPRQAFFTANERRTKQFYELLTATREMKTRPYAEFQESGFQRMLRSVPLDEQGHIDFPGSPEVWTVAKGRSSDEEHTAHLLKKVRRAAAPDVEDAVLTRLADTKYKENNIKISELDNFLAVSSIDAHRHEPMDEESALLLAQKYGDYSAIYPYLTDLRTLTANDYRQFFAAFDRTSNHSKLDANLQLGQLHSLTEWICLLVQRNAIKDDEAANLVRKLASSFAAAEDAASYTGAAIESARAILKTCQPDSKLPPDEALKACLLGRHATANDERLKHYVRIMDAQKVPSLTTLIEIYDATANLAGDKPSLASVDIIQKGVDSLPSLDIPKDAKITGAERNGIVRYDLAPARKVVAQIQEKTAKKKIVAKDIQKLALDLRGELEAQVTAALAGPVYGYFMRSSDAIVINDPLLLRKHHYFDYSSQSLQRERIPESDFTINSEATGSYFIGGFARFAYSAGLAAMHSKNMGGSMEGMAAQLATIRSADWDRLDESDQRLAALRIIVAREWIYESALNPELFHSLGDQTVGLLSLSRRAQLLNGITSREWRRVWDSITLSELFALGSRYVKQFPKDAWASQTTPALRLAESQHNDGRLNTLGPVPTHIFGCNHPHLLSDAPYEEYERHIPAEMGERSAEFKLYLAFQGDRLGIRPQALENVDEKLAMKAFRKAKMTDYRDWRSLLNAYGSVNATDLEQAIRND